jgi:hypothetical protein
MSSILKIINGRIADWMVLLLLIQIGEFLNHFLIEKKEETRTFLKKRCFEWVHFFNAVMYVCLFREGVDIKYKCLAGVLEIAYFGIWMFIIRRNIEHNKKLDRVIQLIITVIECGIVYISLKGI